MQLLDHALGSRAEEERGVPKPDIEFVARRADELLAELAEIDPTDRDGLMRIGAEAGWLAAYVGESFASHPLAAAFLLRLALIAKMALYGVRAETRRRHGPVPPLIRSLANDRRGTHRGIGHVRQRSRERRARRVTRSSLRAGPSDSDESERPPRPRLTAESRAWLKSEVDRARRKQLAAMFARSRALFKDDPGRVAA